MCQSDNNPTIEQTTAESHKWVFNVARIPAPVGVMFLFFNDIKYVVDVSIASDLCLIDVSIDFYF